MHLAASHTRLLSICDTRSTTGEAEENFQKKKQKSLQRQSEVASAGAEAPKEKKNKQRGVSQKQPARNNTNKNQSTRDASGNLSFPDSGSFGCFFLFLVLLAADGVASQKIH
ncbi:hypothetical protein FSOLCH5_008966 [Fusarium solani]|jgi:ribosomal protein S8E